MVQTTPIGDPYENSEQSDRGQTDNARTASVLKPEACCSQPGESNLAVKINMPHVPNSYISLLIFGEQTSCLVHTNKSDVKD